MCLEFLFFSIFLSWKNYSSVVKYSQSVSDKDNLKIDKLVNIFHSFLQKIDFGVKGTTEVIYELARDHAE